MRLHEELFRSADALTGARYTVAFYGGGYFQGVKSVGDFSPQTVVLYFSRGEAEIQGEDLSIAKYADGDLELRGRILNVLTRPMEKTEGKA